MNSLANRIVVHDICPTIPSDMFDIEQKIKTREEIANLSESLKKEKKILVFTNGCFDLLHRGHIAYLREARRMGDVLIVGLNSDSSVRRLKGPERPVKGEEERAFLLSALEFVDYVVIFPEDDPRALLSCIRPDILVKGGDHAPENILGREFAGKTLSLRFVEGFSTTKLIERVKRS